jgi:DNA-binding response OmpR family regulator
MALVVLIDDDLSLLDILSLAFEEAGHQVVSAQDGRAGLACIEQHQPQLVVSDVNMPGLDGFSLCRRLRQLGSTVPILLLTSRDNEIDEALGLELGADDYVAKPFSTRVLLARMRALLRRQERRSGGKLARPPTRLGDLEIDPERMEVRYRGRPIVLTLTEFRLVEALTSRPGLVLSRDRLLDLVRGDESEVEPRIVDTYVRRLRRKFESVAPEFAEIETLIGAGYRWKAHDR